MRNDFKHLPTNLKGFVWYFLKDHKLALSGFAVVAILWSIEMSLSPYLMKVLIDIVNSYEMSPHALIGAISIPAILYASMSLMMNLNFRFYEYICLKVFPQIKQDVNNTMFKYLAGHSHSYFQTHFSGTLVKKINDLVVSIEPVIRIPNDMFIPRLIALVIASLFLYTVHPLFSIILGCWAVIFVSASYFLAKGSEGKSFRLADAFAALNGVMVDSVTNIMSAKIFSNIPHEEKRVGETLSDVVSKDRALQWYMLKVHFVQGLCVTLLVSFLLITLVHGRLNGWVSVGDFAFVLSLAVYFIIGIYNIGQEMVRFAKEIGTCRQALSILIEPHEIIDKPNAKPLIYQNGDIEFKNVEFAYSESKPIFENLNISIKSGEKVGLVGYSGGGKSTFVKLLLRLHDIQKGEILIDSQPVNAVIKSSLTKLVGLIPQDPDLFHRSIMDNIRYGNLSASDDEVIESAKKAHCHEFVMELEDKYKSLVGERGVKLSGGQKQRIAIARAILKNAPILILDEATSSLDSITERYIQDSLHQMMEGKTTIVIAHRLSTLSEMDRILFFKDGEIIEDGSFEVLMAMKEGHFKKLWEMQAGGFIPDVKSKSEIE